MGSLFTSLKPNTKKLAVLASLTALVFTIAFLAGVFKDKSKEPFVAERKYEKFSDFVEEKPDGAYQLKQSRKNALNEKVRRMRSGTEQYVLLAIEDGYYECLHCPRGVFYLYKDEVAKVGITRQGEQGRYDQNFYNRMKLRYVVEYTGSLQEASEREVIRIGSYPLTAENLARPDQPENDIDRYKLSRPPLNTGDY